MLKKIFLILIVISKAATTTAATNTEVRLEQSFEHMYTSLTEQDINNLTSTELYEKSKYLLHKYNVIFNYILNQEAEPYKNIISYDQKSAHKAAMEDRNNELEKLGQAVKKANSQSNQKTLNIALKNLRETVSELQQLFEGYVNLCDTACKAQQEIEKRKLEEKLERQAEVKRQEELEREIQKLKETHAEWAVSSKKVTEARKEKARKDKCHIEEYEAEGDVGTSFSELCSIQ